MYRCLERPFVIHYFSPVVIEVMFMAPGQYSVLESVGSVTVCLVVSTALDRDVTVAVHTQPGSATS